MIQDPRPDRIRNLLEPAAALLVAVLLVTGAAVFVGPAVESSAATIRCTGLDVPITDQGFDTYLSLEEGTLTFAVHGETLGAVTVRYADSDCKEHPILGRLIEHALLAAMQDIADERADLRAKEATGVVEVRGRTLDIEKVRAHLDQWC